MYVFGSGVLIGTPTGGSPINFGLAQEVTLNIATTTKALYGQNNFPVAIGSGTRKMTGKAKLARISGQALGTLFFGVTPSLGGVQTQFGEVTSVPGAVAVHLFHDVSRHIRRRPGRSLRQHGPAAESGRLGACGWAIFRCGGRLYVQLRRRRRRRSGLLHLHRVGLGREHVLVTSQLIGPSITFSANLFAADPTTGKQFSLFLYNCVAEKLALRHQARGLRDAGARLPVLRQRRRSGLPAQLRRRGVSDEELSSSNSAGRRWALPHLPFRLIKAIQPALFKVYSQTPRSARRRADRSADRQSRRRGVARDRACRARA